MVASRFTNLFYCERTHIDISQISGDTLELRIIPSFHRELSCNAIVKRFLDNQDELLKGRRRITLSSSAFSKITLSHAVLSQRFSSLRKDL